MNKVLSQIEALRKRGNLTNNAKRKKNASRSPLVLDWYLMQAVKAKSGTVESIASRFKMTEEKLLENINSELFCVTETSPGHRAIGLTPKALGL